MTMFRALSVLFLISVSVCVSAQEPSKPTNWKEPVFRVTFVNPCGCVQCTADRLAAQQTGRYTTACIFPIPDLVPNGDQMSPLLQFETDRAKALFEFEFGHEGLNIGDELSPLMQFETEQAKQQFRLQGLPLIVK